VTELGFATGFLIGSGLGLILGFGVIALRVKVAVDKAQLAAMNFAVDTGKKAGISLFKQGITFYHNRNKQA
jgi:hypothetical protein